MKKLFIGAAVAALTAATMSAHAAPPMDPNCKMGGAVGNGYAANESWADHYHCWGGNAQAQPMRMHTMRHYRRYHAMRTAAAPAKDPMCKMGGAVGNGYAANASWADHYRCWR